MLVFVSLVLLVTTTCFYFFFVFTKQKYKYWKNKGVVCPEPVPVFGNFAKVMAIKEHPDQVFERAYHMFPNEKVVGLYRGLEPILLIRDLDLIKQVMVKDFHIFQDRGVKGNTNPLNEHLFATEGKKWRILRQKLTPIFTSGKLKNMLPLIQKCVDDHIKYVETIIDRNVDNEVRDTMSKYTLEVIGSCAFGIELNAINDDRNEFGEVGKQIFYPKLLTRFWLVMNMLIPGISNFFGKLADTSGEHFEFFFKLVKNIMSERNGKPSGRKDFMDFMIDLKEQGKATRKGATVGGKVTEDIMKINDEIITAQAFVFYAAGFETSSATMSFMLHELALNPHIQERVHREVDEVFARNNNKISYETLSEFIYLDMVLDATLRKYPIIGTLVRKTAENYTLPGTNITLEKGTSVVISALGLHYDPKYYPETDKFDPEIFSPENKSKIPQMAYMPFGEGPRNCIGLRFAKVQSLLNMSHFLKKFKVEPHEKTVPKVKYHPEGLTLNSVDGIWLKISKR